MRSVRRSAAVLALLVCLPCSAAGAKKDKQAGEADEPRWSEKTFKGLELRGIGPALMSGRIADIAIHPKKQSTWYVAVGSGNVWKTTNAGTTWESIFDDQGSYSVGCVTLDPSNPEIVWVGSGENVSGRHVGYGDGVYRSLDGGKNWSNVGLTESEHIGRILVDPRDSNVVYVAAQGPLWSPGGERGLYKTTDGGKNWEQILAGGEYTGVNEVLMDPRNPDVLFASTHQRFRNVASLVNGGPESAIHKSVDAGKSWRKLESGLPEDEEMGKIGLAISPQNPDVMYATIELAHRKGGFYRSANAGETWEKRNDYISTGTGPHYYQELFASPHRFDRVYQMDVRMHVTEDGGKTLRRVEHKHKHSDNHALAFDPDDPDYLLVGSDGGLYQTWDLGRNWQFVANLPVTQFYKVAIDYDEPFYNIYGGTQDNSTQGGPSRTDNVNGIRNGDWFITLFADGHQPAVDPTNPDIVYSEWQGGNLVRYDRKTGEIVYIQPQPGKDEPHERFNWDSPILISPHDPGRLYYASQRVWRSDDRGDSWRPISGDLTRDLDRLEQPMMGRVQSFDAVWDLWAMSEYGTVTSVSESPRVDGLVYAGSDDGLIHVTEDGGKSWRKIDSLPGIEPFFFVNDIKADLHDADTVYAVVDHHKDGDFAPYVLKSSDRGRSWSSIVGDLPERHIVWRLVQDHVDPDLLFVGTEFGVFFTVDGGTRWVKLSGGAPNIPFRDLVIQTRENDLVGATFGRSIYVFDDYTPLRGLTEKTLEQEAELFPVRKAWWYIPQRPLGDDEKADQGAGFFVAPNPPFGAVFTYYLRDEIKTRKKTRNEKEKKLAEKGTNAPYPGWDELRREELEEDPSIVLTVRDAAGEVVRRLAGPVKAGFHRVAWDLRYPSPAPWKPAKDDAERDDDDRSGFLAAPGSYSVSLARRVDGVLTDLGRTRSFEVVPLRKGTLPGAGPAELVAYTRKLDALQRSVGAARSAIAETAGRIEGIKEALMRSTAGPELDDQARKLEQRLDRMQAELDVNRRRDMAGDPGPVSISRRLDVAVKGSRYSTYGPTPTHLAGIEIVREELAQLKSDLDRLIDVDLPALEKQLDDAGVPWTPGRGVP